MSCFCAIAHNIPPNVPPCEARLGIWPSHSFRLAEEERTSRPAFERPGAGSRRTFDPTTVESIIEYVSEHGVRAASQRFHCEAKTLYNQVKGNT